jgi:hypothetical protein
MIQSTVVKTMVEKLHLRISFGGETPPALWLLRRNPSYANAAEEKLELFSETAWNSER